MLTSYKFPGDKSPIIKGSALAAVDGKNDEIGKNAILELVKAIDEDTSAFDKVIKAMRMPKDTEKEKEIRETEMQKGYQSATLVPLKTVENCRNALDVCHEISEIMDESMASDVGSGALMANAGAKAAAYNVAINLKSITDKGFCKKTSKELADIIKECEELSDKVAKNVDKAL